MIKYTQTEFDNAKTTDLLPIECDACKKVFRTRKNNILNNIRRVGNPPKSCSKVCKGILSKTATSPTHIIKVCQGCGQEFTKRQRDAKYCTKQCAIQHINPSMNSRSKAEVYIADKLIAAGITCITNGRLQGRELDILLKDYNIAIEVNGPTHYIPIFGDAKFKRIQAYDQERKAICKANNIKLIILDISNDKFGRAGTMAKYDTFIDEILTELVGI